MICRIIIVIISQMISSIIKIMFCCFVSLISITIFNILFHRFFHVWSIIIFEYQFDCSKSARVIFYKKNYAFLVSISSLNSHYWIFINVFDYIICRFELRIMLIKRVDKFSSQHRVQIWFKNISCRFYLRWELDHVSMLRYSISTH